MRTIISPGVFMTRSMKYITRKSSTIMIARQMATACVIPGYCGASIMKINMAATPAGGTMLGTATGEAASWIAVGVPELGLDGCAFWKMTCSAAISRTNPPEIRNASMEMRYLPRRVPPASATNAQSAEAITAPRIATSRLNRASAPRVNPAKERDKLDRPKQHEEYRKDK